MRFRRTTSVSLSRRARSGGFADIGRGMALAVEARMRWGFTVAAVLTGCIEGPESKNAIWDISPRPCETAVAADQAFVLSVGADNFALLAHDPPQFEIETPDGTIGMEATVGPPGQLTLRPLAPLPPADFVLELVNPGALGPDLRRGSDLFPAQYSGRAESVIRSYRGAFNEAFISFSTPLDPASVASAVTVRVVGLPVSVRTEYIEGPGHIVRVTVLDDARPVDITFGTSLRASDGAVVFDAPRTIRVDPVSQVPEYNGCESSLL
jgi:hypothetical protein